MPIKKYLITGLLVWLPLAITVWVLLWLVGLLDGVVDHNVRVWDIAAAHAIALGGGAAVRYLRDNPFPLEQFSLQSPRIHYVAGNAEVCARLKELMM